MPIKPITRHPLIYLGLTLLVGFALRVVQLNSLPFSLSLDEATNGLDALQLVRLGRFTPFLQNNFGRETAFFYLQGLALGLYGLSFFALRFSSVVAGTLTLPLLYIVGARLRLDRLLFGGNPLTADAEQSAPARSSHLSLTGLLAATGLAVAYWAIFFNRLGLRANLLPPVLLGLVWCFWRGWYGPPTQPQRRIWLAGTGFLLGFTLYTYLAARLLPLLFLIFVVIDLARTGADRRRRLVDLLLVAAITLLVALPLLLYFQQNPQAIGNRLQAISILAAGNFWPTLKDNLLALLAIHFGAGVWLGQWPALNIISAVGLLFGLAVCLYRLTRPAGLFLLLWLVIGLTPVLFSRQDWNGQTTLLRGLVAWPALFLISAVGLVSLANWLGRLAGKVSLSPRFQTRFFSLAIFWLLLIGGSLTSYHQYFAIWATTSPQPSDHPAHLAAYLNRQTEQLTLTPLKFYGENVVSFLLQARYPNLTNLDAATWRALVNKGRALVYLKPHQASTDSMLVLLAPAADGHGTAYLLPPLTPAQIAELNGYTKNNSPIDMVLDGEQEPIAAVYPLPMDSPFLPLPPSDISSQPAPFTPSEADFNQEIFLTGYQVEPAVVKPGDTVTLRLNWQAHQPVDGDYNLFIHLFSLADGQRYGQINTPLTGLLFAAHRWPVGLSVPDVHYFTLPATAPDGPYRFELGLYHAANQQRLPVQVEPSLPDTPPDDKLILGKFQLWRQPPAPPRTPLPNVNFGQQIALLGLDLPAMPLRPGQTLDFRLHWQALAPIAENYVVFAHLLDAAGNLQAQQDTAPLQGRYPTSWWDTNEIVIDSHTIPVPSDLAPGRYTLRLGLYQPDSGQRLALENSSEDFVDLPDSITIQP